MSTEMKDQLHGATYRTVIPYVEDFAECGARV
jgi:hypothetical protein